MHLYAEPWETRLQIGVQRSQLVLNLKSQAPKAPTRHQNPTHNACIRRTVGNTTANWCSKITISPKFQISGAEGHQNPTHNAFIRRAVGNTTANWCSKITINPKFQISGAEGAHPSPESYT